MGCDIHLYVERLLKDKWVPVTPPGPGRDVEIGYDNKEYFRLWDRSLKYYPGPSDVQRLSEMNKSFEDIYPEISYPWGYGRDYHSFSMLAGVRGHEGQFEEPRGIPEDVSDETLLEFCIRIVPDGHPGADNGEGMVSETRAKIWTDKNYGCALRTIRGQKYIEGPDWHTPTYYTLSELDGHMKGVTEELPVRMKELRTELKKVAKTYKLKASEVRILMWFDN
jgi:hypothetical protein